MLTSMVAIGTKGVEGAGSWDGENGGRSFVEAARDEGARRRARIGVRVGRFVVGVNGTFPVVARGGRREVVVVGIGLVPLKALCD